MKHFTTKLLLSFSFLILGCTSTHNIRMETPQQAGDYRPFISYAKQHIEQQMKKHGTEGLSIAIVDGSSIVWASGFGYADIQNKIKATAHTTYRAASLSKTINAAAILKLQEESRLNIHKPIKTYLPNFHMKSNKRLTNKVTLKNILTHNSGIVAQSPLSGMENPHMASCENLLKLISKSYLKFPPNTVMSYSNQAIALSGCVVEKITQQSYAKYMKKNILDPLDMRSSRFESKITTKNHAKCYENGKEVADRAYYYMPTIGLSTNVMDLSKFLIMLHQDGLYRGNRILQKSSIDKMLTWHNKNIKLDWDRPMALGWFIEDSYPEKFYYHTGRASSYLSTIAFSKKSKIGIVILSNSDTDKPYIGKLAKTLLQKAWESKFGKKLSKQPSHKQIRGLQTDFEDTYALEFPSKEIVTIKKSKEAYRVQTSHGIFSLEKSSDGCYKINDLSHIVRNIDTLKSIPKDSCFYTISSHGLKGLVYRTPDKRYVGFATKFQENASSIESWNQHLGSYTPVFTQHPLEKALLFKEVKLTRSENHLLLYVSFKDGWSSSSPLYILDNKHAKGSSIAAPLGIIEINKKSSGTYMLIDGYMFLKDNVKE